MNVIAIIPAAGLGTRMSPVNPAKVSKQFFEVGGVPILIRTLRQFVECTDVNQIVVALRAAEVGPFQARLSQERYAKNILLVQGGDHRQESVYQALKALQAAPDDIVLVHDGVRPFVDAEIIENVIAATRKTGAAIAGLPAVDTVKQVERTSDGAIITSTIPRERVVMAQTPQGFRYDVIRKAFDDAAVEGYLGTDEASLVERSGHRVDVVMGSPRNIKITTPADMEIAELYARGHE
jgi:2-C-methyl-D-erythritol 4-phosphate cytidylyltransferase